MIAEAPLGAHHASMSPRHWRPFASRGTSVLAALILVAALSTVVYAVESLRPDIMQTGAQAAAAESSGTEPGKSSVDLKGDERCNAPIKLMKDKKADAKIDPKQNVTNACVKGCLYKVTQSKISTDGTHIAATDTCKRYTKESDKKNCEQRTPCQVQDCSGQLGCVAIGPGEKSANKFLAERAKVQESLPVKDDSSVKEALELTKKDPPAAEAEVSKLPRYLQDAYGERVKEEREATETKLADNRATIEALTADDPIAKELREENKKLEAEKANLDKVNLDRLTQDKVTLKPDGEWKDTPWEGDPPKIGGDAGECPGSPGCPGYPNKKMECPGDPDCPGAPGKTDPRDPNKKMLCPGDPDCPGEPPIPGQKVAQDTYCVKQTHPVVIIPIPAGSTFPEGCYNGVGAKPITPPQTREAQTCPSGTYGTPPYCQRPYQGPPGSTFSNPGGGWGQPGGGSGGANSGLNSFLSGLMKGLTGQQQPPPPGNQNPFPNGTCMPSYVCSNNSLYFRNSQCVDQLSQTCQYGCQGTQCAPAPQTQCPPAPAQPSASACPNGTWQEQRQTISTGASCVTGWKCVTAPIGTTTPPVPEPTALLSCQPRVADIGMEIAITYTCGNASSSVAVGFSTGGQTSGSTTTIASAPAGTNTITYGLTCINQDKTARAQCVVQVGRPSIVLVANPKTVKEGEASSVGWITSGMQSCVVSSPDLPEFTAENADKTNVNGTAPTPPLTKNANIVLKCATLGGGERTATTSITVIEATGPRVSVRSSFDGRTVTRGTVASIEWQVTKATSTNASVALWLIDVQSQESVALIAAGRPLAGGSYSWTVPSTGEPCPSETPYVCAGDIVPGQSYAVQASVYTPQNADLSRNPPAGAPRPVYIASGISAAFTLGQ